MWLYTNDTNLVLAIKKGIETAFQFLYNRFYNPLVAYILMLCHNRDHSEDVVQNSFISVWEKREQLDEHRPVKPYLYAVAYRRFVDDYRKEKRQQSMMEDLKIELLNEVVEEDEAGIEREEKVQQLIAALPPRCREILELNKIKGLKYREIAEKLNISVKTVEAQMAIAFQRIREGWA